MTEIDKIMAHDVVSAYRIVECRGDDVYTLFHAIPYNARRYRKIPIGKWIPAEHRMVTDGSSEKKYLSGFNVILDLEKMKKYVGRFTKKRDLRIIKVKVELPLRPKEHSKSDVYLADYMMIPKNWKKSSIKIKLAK